MNCRIRTFETNHLSTISKPMAFKSLTISFLCYLCFSRAVLALRVIGPAQGSFAKKQIIKDATALADARLSAMEYALNHASEACWRAHMENAFGRYANLNGIRTVIQQFRNGRYRMEEPESKGLGMGHYDTAQDVVEFGHSFFTSGVEIRAGAVMHEASHAIARTVDHFTPQGQPVPQGQTPPPGSVLGYVDSKLDVLKANPLFGPTIHLNADSYRLLAHTLATSLSAPLVRRGLEGET
ncbi:unnamed protein product [Cyclocybe aegerita]|uniref:Uncharacterized protein n=1 Tax=Cyclocybe aegerita TaxID=1973307 RepID=A0A8S0XQQ5_CYCAE|nr:unnamed protein product [Cyclocybe aegerita]